MKNSLILLVSSLFVLLMSACKPCPPVPKPTKCPDIVVSAAVAWNGASKLVNVMVSNIGNAPAGNFLVYVNAEENPVSQNHRPQISHQVSALEAGASIELPLSDFTPLEHPDNHNLQNVYAITVIADPKGMVAECDSIGELNNRVTITLPHN
jgi:hypothetical protein